MNEDVLVLLLYFGGPLLMLGVAFFGGNVIARRHEADLAARYAEVAQVVTSDVQSFPEALAGAVPTLVAAEVTLGIDHFRGFLGNLKNLLGGEVRSYQATLDRARREAILRVLEQAHEGGYNAVGNLRVEFADISGNATMKKKASMVTILAFGTAYSAAA